MTVDDIVSGTGDVFDANDYQSNNGSPMYGADSPNAPEKPSYDGYTTGEGYANGYDNSGLNETNPNAPKSLSARGDAGEEKGIFDKATDFGC